MFEILRRDGMARIGRFTTTSGRELETPALLPVVNPKIKTVTPRELYDEFGFRALITNSYIIKNNEALNNEARAKGLHELLDFPGVIMTDSGTFQSHMYGTVPLTNTEIVEFQKSIGTDIGTVLDIFTEPDWSREKTKEAVDTTLERTKEAAAMKGDMMINGVIQGSIYTDLRTYCAEKEAVMDIDVHPIGGVVPLMEQYRFAELVDVIMSSKMGINHNRPVHLFGAGHPMILAFATLMGCDLFDSASYAKFAKDDRMLFIDGTFRLQDMQSLDCSCPACAGRTLQDLRGMSKDSRTKLIARHNLYQIKNELALVRRYILEGRLWELAEQRCRAHPALLDGLRRLRDYQGFTEKFDPVSREGGLFYTGEESRNRPVYLRYNLRLATRYIPFFDKAAVFDATEGKPYSRALTEEFQRALSNGYVPVVCSPMGPVPMELDELYPNAQSIFPTIPDPRTEEESDRWMNSFLEGHFRSHVDGSSITEMGDAEIPDMDLVRASAVARYQFGIRAAEILFRGEVTFRTSRKTGKIRNVFSDGEHVLSMRAGDGLYTLRMEGARRLVQELPAPFMRAVVSEDAVPFAQKGRNMFAQFIRSVDNALVPKDEVIVVSPEGEPVAIGQMLLAPAEIGFMKKGVAIKVRSGNDEED